MSNGFTENANRALNYALRFAESLGHTYIGIEHILFALTQTEGCKAANILAKQGICGEQIKRDIVEDRGQDKATELTPQHMTPRFKQMLRYAAEIAKRSEGNLIGTEHLLFAICEDYESVGFEMLKKLGFVWKEKSMNVNSLDRFLAAQEKTYETALAEIKRGEKRTHWMWYIFPQLRGLGMSPMAHTYGISGLDEAKAYLNHPVLSERLLEICGALLEHKNKSAYDIFGEIDKMKLKSSMTLFALISEDGSVFHQVLDAFYDGEQDKETLNLLSH